MNALSPTQAQIEYLKDAIAHKSEQLRRERDHQRRWVLQQQLRSLGEDLQQLLAGPAGRQLRGEDAVWSVAVGSGRSDRP